MQVEGNQNERVKVKEKEHQEECAYKTEDDGTKQIWMKAVSTCVVEAAFEQQASSGTTQQLCTICSHLSHFQHDRLLSLSLHAVE